MNNRSSVFSPETCASCRQLVPNQKRNAFGQYFAGEYQGQVQIYIDVPMCATCFFRMCRNITAAEPMTTIPR